MSQRTTPKFLLRIGAVLMLLHAIGHTFGALNWKKAPNELVGQTIKAMETNHFLFMGRQITLASFYSGYGVAMIWVLLLISTLLWLLSYEIERPSAARMLPVMVVFLLLLAVSEYIYFFPSAAAFTLLAALCALFARIGISVPARSPSFKQA